MNIYLSQEAEGQLQSLLEYLDNEWGERVCDNFIEKLERAMHTIILTPLAFPMSEKISGLHKCVVTRQTSIYYRISSTDIEIVSILDNRQNL
jgi:plasmid stabilization system protein ParE